MRVVKNSLLFILFYSITAGIFYLAATTVHRPDDFFSSIRLVILILFAPIILKYIVHLFVAPWYPLVEFTRSKKYPVGVLPSVSVLIPAWNEEVGIVSTIRSVVQTQYPNLEIIIINDGSTDGTENVILKYIEKHKHSIEAQNVSIIYRRVENGGKAKALNTGLMLARGSIIVTIDADSVMDRHAIHNLVKRFGDPKVASVAGNVVIGNRSSFIGLIQQLEYLYGFYFKRADSILHAVYIVGGAAASYRKDVIVKLGGFDERIITEDIELSTRLQDQGFSVCYAADAIVYTEGPSEYAGLFRQRLRWKFGRLVTFFKYRHLFFSTQKKHNLYLTFLILPIALFAEILLLFEGILLTLFYTYTFYTNDFAPLVFFIAILTTIIMLQVLTDTNRRYHLNIMLLAPVAWIIFYVLDFIEFQALVRSVVRLLNGKKELAWQRWKRVGVFGNSGLVIK